jgi:hypothetical protein
MPRNLIVLLLVAALGLGFLAGVHPCEPAHEEEMSQHASCHETGSMGLSLRAAPDFSDRQDCCDTLCRHSCHTAAVAEIRPVPFVVAPVSQTVVQSAGRVLPALSYGIDHVPLV